MIYLGLDLGQAADFTALCAMEVSTEQAGEDSQGVPVFDKFYDVRHLQRFDIGTAYPEIVRKMVKMCETPQLKGNYRLIPDATGVGRPVVDLLREARLSIVPVSITFGSHANFNETTGFWDVPKKELISNLQILFGNHRLRFASGLKDRDAVTKELMNFRIKVTKAGNDTYESWREGDHDDLVLSVAMAAWYAVKFGGERKNKAEQWVSPLASMKGL